MAKKKTKRVKELNIQEFEAKIHELKYGRPKTESKPAQGFEIKWPGKSGIRKTRYGKEGNYFKLIYTRPKS